MRRIPTRSCSGESPIKSAHVDRANFLRLRRIGYLRVAGQSLMGAAPGPTAAAYCSPNDLRRVIRIMDSAARRSAALQLSEFAPQWTRKPPTFVKEAHRPRGFLFRVATALRCRSAASTRNPNPTGWVIQRRLGYVLAPG